MKKIYILLAIILLLTPSSSYGRTGKDHEYIDVGIGRNYSSFERVRLYSTDGISIFQKDYKEEAMMELPAGNIYVSLSLGSFNEIDVYDQSNTYVTTIPANGLVLFGGFGDTGYVIEVDGMRYRGYLSFIGSREGLRVINHLYIEDYLYGVVPREIPASASHEALKAQAVAARSYTYTTINKHIAEGYNVCDTTHCQVYGGHGAEHPNTNKAVDDTRGLVAAYRGAVANTVFHSSSGGHTESSENVWGGRVPYLTAKADPYSMNSVNSNWTIDLTLDKLSSILSNGGVHIGNVNGLSILEKTDSGRVTELLVSGSSGDATLSGDRFRSLVGTNEIKSTLFTIEGGNGGTVTEVQGIFALTSRRIETVNGERGRISIIDGSGRIRRTDTISVIGEGGVSSYSTQAPVDISRGDIVISGRGFGHGIGMSQYGAMEMAKLGFDFEEILKHYYTGVEIIEY